MKHETLDALRLRAEFVTADCEIRPMSRRERLRRWADVLEQHQGPVRPFYRVEYLTPAERRSLRSDDTPLTVAFNDPILRADGLASDRLGDGLAYFELSDQTGHRLLCDCHYNGAMTADHIASRLRAEADGNIFQRLWAWATDRGQ